MMAALDRLACRIGSHRWTRVFVGQFPTCRVVSRYCTRCDATRHIVQDVWNNETREFTTHVNDWLGAA